MRSFQTALLAVAIFLGLIGLSFVSPQLGYYRQSVRIDLTCKFSSVRDCLILFDTYRVSGASSPFANRLAERAGTWVCNAKRASACAELGQVFEKDLRWKQAIKSYQAACDLGESKSCVDELILLSAAGRLDEGLERAQEDCKKNIDSTCYLGGVLAQKLKNKTAAVWAFHRGCFEQSTLESCLALSGVYSFDGQVDLSRQALGKACDFGSTIACLKNSLLQERPPAVAATNSATGATRPAPAQPRKPAARGR